MAIPVYVFIAVSLWRKKSINFCEALTFEGPTTKKVKMQYHNYVMFVSLKHITSIKNYTSMERTQDIIVIFILVAAT